MTKSGAFSISPAKLDEARFDPYTLKGFQDPEEFKRRVSTLPEDEAKIEEALNKTAWYPYARLDFLDRTTEFVKSYNKILLSFINFNASLSSWAKESRKNSGCYIKQQELLAPWVNPKVHDSLCTNPRWRHWVAARRCADKRSMVYDDFNAGAVIAARKRGWKFWPQPQALHSPKLLGLADKHEDSIESFERKRYDNQMKLTDDPYFDAYHYECSEIQNAYLHHIAKEIIRVNPGLEGHKNFAAERLWKDFQSDGRVPAFLLFDDVLHNRFV